jgi:hypothetical protein
MKEIERQKILAVFSNGAKMLSYYEAIGMEFLRDFKGGDAAEIAFRIDIYLGGRRMNKLGVQAIQNVIDVANEEERVEILVGD